MGNLIVGYRIYPSWFRTNTYTKDGPMSEMAQGSAANMGRRMLNITTVGFGINERGHFIDFDVTYSSTDALMEVV